MIRTIEVNGLLMGIGSNIEIEPPLSGFGRTETRNSIQNYSGRDGGRVNGQFASGRQMSIPLVIDQNCTTIREDVDNLYEALPIREDLDVTVTDLLGNEYFTTAIVIDIQDDITAMTSRRFKVELYAGDPSFYLGDSLNSVIIPKYVGGGAILPFILPVILGAGASPTDVVNDGTVDIYPTFTIVGSSTHPIIRNMDTGEKIDINISMSSGDTLIIDTAKRTITLNGGSVLSLRSSDSSWWPLRVGSNNLQYETSAADTGVLTATWRSAVSGI